MKFISLWGIICFFCLYCGEVNPTVVGAAKRQIGVTTMYDPSYVKLAYPNGDVDLTKGVCADVVVRSLRGIGIDLQKEMHEDMKAHFAKYPKHWGLKKPDSNIDHRRVPNIMTFLERKKKSEKGAFLPGDIVAWKLQGGLYHIGIVSDSVVPKSQRYFMIHNIGAGTQEEDVLNSYEIIGHYRW